MASQSANNKRKGSKYERKVCHRLSLWVSAKTRQDVFWRSSMSGGRARIKSRVKGGGDFRSQAGDICAIHATGSPLLDTFLVECKTFLNFKVDQLIFGEPGKLGPIFTKLMEDCEQWNRLPFLVCKQPMKPEIVITNRAGYVMLRNAGRIALMSTVPPYGMYIVLLRHILQTSYAELAPHLGERDVRTERVRIR